MTRAEIRRLIISVYIPTALFMFGVGLLVPILPLYAAEFGGSYALAGFVVSAGWAGQVFGALPVGMILKRIGFRQALIISGVLFGGATIALGFAGSPFELVVLRLIAGVGIAFFIISRHTYLAQSVPVASRGRAISFFVGTNRFGHFVGPLVGGFVGQYYGLAAAIIVGGVVAGAVIALTLAMLQEPKVETTSKGSMFDVTVFRDVVKYNPQAYAAGAVAQVFGQMVRAGRQIVIPLYGAYVIGLDTAQVGQVVAISSAIDVFLFLPAGIIMDRWGRKAAAVPSFAIMGIGLVLIPVATGFISLTLVALLIGFGQGIGLGTMMTIGADLSPPGRVGEFLALWRLTGDSGHAVAPMAIGALADIIGLGLTSGLVGGMGFISAATLGFFVTETRQKGDPKAETKPKESPS